MLELDCHLTLDGQVVVSHDNCLLRICGCEMLISQTDYKDLPSLKPELPLDFNPNVIVGSPDRHIPLLEEVFQTFPNMPINIDIKVNDGNLIEKVSALIKKYNREEITVWGNKQQAISTKCYKCNPNIPLIFSLRRVLILLALYYSGLLPFVPLRETFLEIVMPSIILDETKSLVELSRKKRLFIRFCDILLMRPSLFKHLEKRGIQLMVKLIFSLQTLNNYLFPSSPFLSPSLSLCFCLSSPHFPSAFVSPLPFPSFCLSSPVFPLLLSLSPTFPLLLSPLHLTFLCFVSPLRTFPLLLSLLSALSLCFCLSSPHFPSAFVSPLRTFPLLCLSSSLSLCCFVSPLLFFPLLFVSSLFFLCFCLSSLKIHSAFVSPLHSFPLLLSLLSRCFPSAFVSPLQIIFPSAFFPLIFSLCFYFPLSA
ncbi:GDPD1_3 [Acanthosepion pharaonis]|uniref:GDPD1_3 n=1 Tax=Acanthosepion pharaonis TaxID=158019 RepID=A0A812CPP0_ACAPH|nr:GDPD1_3 [Sepia pharaonis]